jgi:hypothetical protein
MRRLFVITLGMLMLALTASATPMISVGNIHVATNSTANLDVSITDIPDLFGFQFDIFFDPNYLFLNGDTPGSLLTTSGLSYISLGAVPDNTNGTYFGAGYVFFGASGVSVAPGDNGVLLTLNFNSLSATAVTPVTIDNIILLDSNLDQITDFQATNGSVTIPEPASMLLLVPGLLGVARMRRKRS